MTSSNDFLISEYIRRKSDNNRYSERAFAKSLGLSPGFLKLFFQGKKHLSFMRAREIAFRFQWTEAQRLRFLNSILIESTKKANTLKGKLLLNDLNFFEISDWFHFAIIELIKANDGETSIDEICRRLLISKVEATFALKHLKHLDLVKEITKNNFSVPDAYEMPSSSSEGIRKYHKQMLQYAKDSVEDQDVLERDLRGLTIAFDKSRIQEAKKDIQKFVAQFEKKYGKGSRNSVYQLSLAFFRLDKGKL